MPPQKESSLKWADAREACFVALDPGDKNVGLARFEKGVCVSAIHTDPGTAINWLYSTAYPYEFIVFERFVLRSTLARQQGGSEMKTSQMIGQIKLVGDIRGVPCFGQTNTSGKVCYKIKPWNEWPLRRWKSYGSGGHAKDAECGGYSFLRACRKKQGLRDADWTEMQ